MCEVGVRHHHSIKCIISASKIQSAQSLLKFPALRDYEGECFYTQSFQAFWVSVLTEIMIRQIQNKRTACLQPPL